MWTFLLLVRHPDVLDSLKREIGTLRQDDNISRTELNGKYALPTKSH